MNNYFEEEYKSLIKRILNIGNEEPVRDGNTAKALFGEVISFNCSTRLFPILTSKEMFFKNIKYELKWMLLGLSNVNYLKNNGVSIWNKWANEHGDIGDTYGRQLRSFNGVDQVKYLTEEIEKNIYSRQIVISLWNPVAIHMGNLKPCYHAFQFCYIGEKMNILVSQRSADVFIGLPYDICTFTLLLYLVCCEYNLTPGVVQINIGNAHIYKEHYSACEKYLFNQMHDLPRVTMNKSTLKNFEPKDVWLSSYKHEEFIPAKIII